MNYKIKKIAVITGTRAEFGILSPLIRAIDNDDNYILQLVVSAMHLSPEFGFTIEEIHNYGFKVDKKVECLLSSDSSVGVSKSIALALIGFADAFEELQPDLILILGDRSEMLAAATAASMANIPIAHLHGGETTEGAYDEAIRHAITKMSFWHFAATEAYRKRIIQLGEDPIRVFNVGAIGLDSVKNLSLLSQLEIEEFLGIKIDTHTILITYHPVTLEKASAKEQFGAILEALDSLDNAKFIFTHSNSDKEGRLINNMIEKYVSNNPNKAISFKSLGQLRYFSCLKFISAVLGNSSSGIVEVPYFNIPTINIGDRQKGRIAPESVIQSTGDVQSIRDSIELALSNKFNAKIQKQEKLYGDGNTVSAIMNILKSHTINDLKKPFYDIQF